ncbi:hypothetical protein ACTFTM_00100 [Micromonospora sp. RB23]
MTYPDIPPSHPDPEKLRALAQKWDEQAGRLDSYGGLVRSSVDGIQWEGQAHNAMRLAADKVIEQVGKAAQGAREWANALREVAGKWEEFLRKQKVDAILQALLGVFGVLLLVVSFVLGPILAAVADILIGMTSLTGLARTIATLVLDIALGVLTYGGLQLGFDMAAGGIAHAAVPGSGRFKPDAWEALSVGLAGLMGGLGSIRGLPGLGRGGPKGGVGNVVDVPVTPSTSRGVSNVGEIGETARPGGSSPLSATPHVDAAAGGPRAGVQRAAGPPEGIAGNGPLSSARITPDAGRSFDASGGALGARGNAAFERVPGGSADGGVPGVPRALTGDGPATVVRKPPAGDQPGLMGPPRASLDGPSAVGPIAPRGAVDGPPAVGQGGPRAAVDGPPTVGSGAARVGVDGPATANPGSFRAATPEASSSARIAPVAERPLDATGGASGARGGVVSERTPGVPQATGEAPTTVVRNSVRPPSGEQVAPSAGPRAVLDGPPTGGSGGARVGQMDAAASPHGTQPGGPAREGAGTARQGTGRVAEPPRTADGEVPTSVVSSGGRTPGRSGAAVDSPPRDAVVAGPSVGVGPHAAGAPPTLPRAALGHGEPPTAITVSAADALKVPRADPSLPGKLPAVSAPVPKPSLTSARPVGSESISAAGVGARETPTPSTAGGASRAADGAPATSATRSATPGATPRSPEAGRPVGAEPVRSAAIDRAEVRSDAGGARPARGELDTVARNLSDRHADLVSAKAVRAERIPDPKEAAAARRITTAAEARAQFWSSVREGMAAQFGPHAGLLAGQNTQTLERFAAFFASEAGVAKELPAIRTMIGRDFSATIQGEMAGAVKTVAADIVRRAGLPASRFDPLLDRLGSTKGAEFRQAMDDFRNAIRDHRTEQARGGRYDVASDRPTTLDQARTKFDADAAATAARDARAAAGERSDPQLTRAADDAAQVRRQVETEARNWAADRDKEFTTLSKSIGKQFADERYATAYVQREHRVEYRPGDNPTRALDDAVGHINRRWEAAVRSASAVQRFRPDADAAFNAEVQATRNIAGLTKVAGPPRLRSLESLPEKEAAEWRASFRNAVDDEFERVWRPVYEAGHGPGSARFQATEKVWEARFRGMREQLRVNGFAYHEIERLADDIATARADLVMRGGSPDDVIRALQRVREKYHTEIGELVRGIDRRGPNLARWDDLTVQMQTEVREAFHPGAVRDRPPAGSERVAGDDPFTDQRPVPDGSPASALHPDLVGVRDQAFRDFAGLDPLSQAKLPKSMLDRLEATYVHERLTAYDAIMHTGETRVPAQVLHDLRVEARSTAGGPTPTRPRSAPESWAEHRRQISELLNGRGLAVTPTSGGLVVHVDAAQAVADTAVVRATRGLGELPDGLRIVAGPGVRPEVDLAGLGPLARDGVVLHAPFLDDAALVGVARDTGLTVAFRTRPAPGDAVAHPVDGTGVATLQHLAVEWRSGVPAVDAPFGLTPGARPGVYRLDEGWTLESHAWGVWARPPEVRVGDAFDIRLGEVSDDGRVVVGVSGVDVPDAVIGQIHRLAERMPAGEGSGITWLSRPGARETTAHLVDDLADSTTLARTQKYGDAFDLAETRRLVREKANRDFTSVEPTVDGSSSIAVDKLRRAYEADAEALVTKYLGGPDGLHGHADVVGFARGYDELRSTLPARFDAQARWEGRADEVRRSVEEAFHRDARLADRAELLRRNTKPTPDGDATPTAEGAPAGEHIEELPEPSSSPKAGPSQTGDHITAFWERFSPTAAKEIDDLAKAAPQADRGAAVDARITDLARDARRYVDNYLTGDSTLANGLSKSRAIGDELRPGGNAVADEVVATLSSQTRHAFDRVFGPDGAFGVERWKPGSTFAGSTEARQLDDIFAPEHVTSVEKRVRSAFESLQRHDPKILTSPGLSVRLTVAHQASIRLEEVAAARMEARTAAGLRPDLTPEQLSRFQDDLIARVDDGLHTSGPRSDVDVEGDVEGAAPRGAASAEEAKARFDELTGDRLATELDLLAEPHLVRFTRDSLKLRLDDVAGPLDGAGLNRIGSRLDADVRRAYDEVHSPGRPPEEANAAWTRRVDELRAGLPDRVAAELDSLTVLRSAAQEFHAIESSAALRSAKPLDPDVVADLATAHRAEFTAARDKTLRSTSERTTWLADEHVNGDQYGSHLTKLRRDAFIADLESRLDADLRDAVDSFGLQGADRAAPEAVAKDIQRAFAKEMRDAQLAAARRPPGVGDDFTSVWQRRYDNLSGSVDSRMKVAMMERRVEEFADEFVNSYAGDLPRSDVRRLGDVIAEDIRSALQGGTRHLPASLGAAEQRALVEGIRPSVLAVAELRLKIDGAGEPLHELAPQIVESVTTKLLGPEVVPTSAETIFARMRDQATARVDDAIAEALGTPNPFVTEVSRAAAASAVRDQVLRNLNQEYTLAFDRARFERRLDETLQGIDRRIDAQALYQETEQRLLVDLKRDVPQALAGLDRNASSKAALAAAGEAFTNAVTAEFHKLAGSATFSPSQVKLWNAQYATSIGTANSWVTAHLVGQRLEQIVQRHLRGAPGTNTEVEATRRGNIRQRLQQVVTDGIAPYLNLSGDVRPLSAMGVEEQAILADQIGRRLDEVARSESVSPLRGRAVRSLREHPVSARSGEGLAAERVALNRQIEERLDDVSAAYEPGPVLVEARQALADRARGHLDEMASADLAFDRDLLAKRVEQTLAGANEFVASRLRRAAVRTELPSVVRSRVEEALRDLPPQSTTAVDQFVAEAEQQFDRAYPANGRYGEAEAAQWQSHLDDMFRQFESWLVAHAVAARAVARASTPEQAAAVSQRLRPYLDLSLTRPLPVSMGPREQEMLGRSLLADSTEQESDAFAEELRSTPVPTRPGNDFATRRAQLEKGLNEALTEARTAIKEQARQGGGAALPIFREGGPLGVNPGRAVRRHLDSAIEAHREEIKQVLAAVDAEFRRNWRAEPSSSGQEHIAGTTSAVTSRVARAYAVAELQRDLETDVVGPAAAAFRTAVLQQVTASVPVGQEFGIAEYDGWQREYRRLIERSQAWQTVRALADRAYQLAVGRGGQNKRSRRFAGAIDKVVKPYLDLGSSRKTSPAQALGLPEQERLVGELARVIPRRAGEKLMGLVRRNAVASDPAWGRSYYPVDFAHERIRLDNRLRSEAPGTDEASTAFRDDQLRRFDAANQANWNFDRAAWMVELDKRIATRDDWIRSYEHRVAARTAFADGLRQHLDASLEKLLGPKSTMEADLAEQASAASAVAAAAAFHQKGLDEFDETYPLGSRFTEDMGGLPKQRLRNLTLVTDGWLTLWQIGSRIALGLRRTAIVTHGVHEAYEGPVSQTVRRLMNQVEGALGVHLSLRRRQYRPAGLRPQEQAAFAAHLVERVRAADAAAVGIAGDVGEAVRQWLLSDPVAVPDGNGHATQRARLQAELGQLPGDTAAVAAHQADVLREFDEAHAQWWKLETDGWRDHLAQRLTNAPAWIKAYSRWQQARAEIQTDLRADLDKAKARWLLPEDEATAAADEYLKAVTEDFERRYPSPTLFGADEQTWWQNRVGGIRSRLDAWVAVRTVAARARNLAADAAVVDRAVRPYLDVATIDNLPAVFGPAERDALLKWIVPRVIEGADDAVVDSFRDEVVPAQEGVGYAAERAAVDRSLSELLPNQQAKPTASASPSASSDKRAVVNGSLWDLLFGESAASEADGSARSQQPGSEVDTAAAAAASEAFRAAVLADLDARFAGDWNYDRKLWQKEYDDAVKGSGRWRADWAAGYEMRREDRDKLDLALHERAADQATRELVLGAFDRLYNLHDGSASAVARARQRWQAQQNRILDGLDEYARRTALTTRLTDEVVAVVADRSAQWREEAAADWELDQLTELGRRLVSGLEDARLAGVLPGLHSTHPVADLTGHLDREVRAWAAQGGISARVRTLAAGLRAVLTDTVRDALDEPEPAQATPTPAVEMLTRPDLAGSFRRRVLGVIAGPLREAHVAMEQDFIREAEEIFNRPAGSVSEAVALADLDDLIQLFRAQEPLYQRVVAIRREAGDVAALREQLKHQAPKLVDGLLASFEQSVRQLIGYAWTNAHAQFDPKRPHKPRVSAAADIFEDMHAKLVAATDQRIAEIHEAEKQRVRADELITTQLRDFETEHGNLDPQARMIVRYAAQTLVVPAHRDLGAGAVEALDAQFRLAGAYSRFVAHLPAATPEAVRRDGLDAYTRLLVGGPADAADQLERLLAALVGRAGQQAVGETPVAVSTSESDLPAEARESVPAVVERGPASTGDGRTATRNQRAELRREGRRRARADELIDTYLRISEVKHGELDPQARELAHQAARPQVIAADRVLGTDALQTLRRLSGFAHEYSRFVADLPDGAPEEVRREGLEAYTRRLTDPADSADQLAWELAVLVDQARQPILDEGMAVRASDPDRLTRALRTVPAGEERTALEGFLRARVDQTSAELAHRVRIAATGARFAPDRVDAALDEFGADLDRAALDWADNAALRALASRPEGREFLRQPSVDTLDTILSSLARDASRDALATLPSLLAALPSMGPDTAVVRNLLINVAQFLEGDADAYDMAFKRAAFVRVRSRGALMEFVMALHVLNPRMVELGNRIMDC